MKVPTFIRLQATDKDGYFSDQIQQVFDVLFQQMQTSLSDDGFEIPQLSTQNINDVSNPSDANSKPNGTIWYDSDTNQFKGKVNGTIKIFTVA